MRLRGRWHLAETPVVYLGESPSAVLLEMCVHTAVQDVPPAYTLLRVEGPDVEVSSLATGSLPADWTSQVKLTRELGTRWLKSKAGVLLEVPSAIVPYTSNYLFNPLHQLAGKFRIVEAMHWPFDERLKR